MYSYNELPMISMSVFYYDTEYRRQTAECVLDILKRNQMFLPSRMRADHLTQGRMKKYTPEMQELFLSAYGEPDVLGIEWETGNPQSSENFLGFQWDLTFLKMRNHIQSSFQPWNILTLDASYGWFSTPKQQINLLRCIKELSDSLGAFCAKIDDMANSVDLRHQTDEPSFSPSHIQQVYWGNYWGQHLFSQVQIEKLRSLNLPNYAETESGVFFTLTHDVFDFNSRVCNVQRKKITKMICRRDCE